MNINGNNSDYAHLIANGNNLAEMENFDAAMLIYQKAAKIENTYEVNFLIGQIYLRLKKYHFAIRFFEKALLINKFGIEALVNLGATLNVVGDFQRSVTVLDVAIGIDRLSKEAWLNQGVAYAALGNFERSAACYEHALQIDPNYLEALSNKGNAEFSLRNFETAKKLFDQALRISPSDADTLSNYSVLKLADGNFDDGFLYYESRFVCKEKIFNPFIDIPKLLSIDRALNKKLVIWAEQGLGDTIQFCRYLNEVIKYSKEINFVVQDELFELMKETFPQIKVTTFKNVPRLRFDYQCPLMSLPLLFKTNLNSIPAEIPYVFPYEKKTGYWSNRLKNISEIKIGVIWKGGEKKDPSLAAMNQRRNISLEYFESIFNIGGALFFPIQKNINYDEIRIIEKLQKKDKLINFTDKFHNFSDTAAFVSNLDLIISVDTSVAHLAGALGKPVWLLNRYDSCWRWLQNRQDSPWYPTMRIFPQTSMNDWLGVLSRVETELNALIQ